MLILHKLTIFMLILFPVIAKSEEYFVGKKECNFMLPDSNDKIVTGFSYKFHSRQGNLVKFYLNDKIFSVDQSCGTINNFISFFDNKSLGFNIAEPILDDFDENIMKICGKFGNAINSENIMKIIEHTTVMQNIYENLDRSMGSEIKQTFADFKIKFMDVWIKNDALKKILCGLINNGELQGMNYIGAYINGYKNGWLGYDESCTKNVYKHPVYILGVLYANKDGEIKKQCALNSFYSLSAKDLIIEATQAYKKFSKITGKCIYYINNNDDEPYASVLIKQDDAIFSFDATLNVECSDCECK